MYRDYEDGAFARLRAEAAAIAQGLGAAGSDYFDSFAPDDRVTWIAANGTVLYDSAAPAQLLESHADREEIDHALQTGEAQTSRYSQTLLQRTFYYAKLLEGGTVLRVSCTQNSLPAMILMLLTPFFVGGNAGADSLRRAVLPAGAADHEAPQRHQSRQSCAAAELSGADAAV